MRFTPLSLKGLTPQAELGGSRRCGQSAVFSILADNVQIIDCDLAWTKASASAPRAATSSAAAIGRTAEQGGWCPVGGGRRAIVEENEFSGVTTGITRGAEVWFARNTGVAHVSRLSRRFYHGRHASAVVGLLQ